MIELNKIYQGDCLEIMPQISDKSIDMILCDLPYGTTACKWDTVIPFEPLWKQYKRLIKDNGAIVLTASQPFTSALVMSNLRWFKYEWIWRKSRASNFMLNKKQPLKYHENILLFYKNHPTYNPIMWKGNKNHLSQDTTVKNNLLNIDKITYRKNINDIHYPASIIDIKSLNPLNNKHPTQKPVALFEYLICTYTNEGDTVLDNCAGSGTTGVACKNLNRKFILIEKDINYCQIAEERIKNFSSKQRR